MVLGDEKILGETFCGISDGGLAVVGTEQQANGRVVVRLHHLMTIVVQIEVQLGCLFVTEAVNL